MPRRQPKASVGDKKKSYRALALSQSIYVALPHMVTLIAITFICFGVSCAVFMRQEIGPL